LALVALVPALRFAAVFVGAALRFAAVFVAPPFFDAPALRDAAPLAAPPPRPFDADVLGDLAMTGSPI
jgi:hypothetical protein